MASEPRRPKAEHVRRIELPDGRTIEVIRFDDIEGYARRLHVCANCGSELVQPMRWQEDEGARWRITLVCPNCDWCEMGVYERIEVEMLEESLDRGVASMIEDLERLQRSNMADDIERFVAALQADQVLPEDF